MAFPGNTTQDRQSGLMPFPPFAMTVAEVCHALAIDGNMEREQWEGLSQEGKRGLGKFGEERKGHLLGKTDQGPPVINPPKIQPDPWINTMILCSH